MNEEIWKFDVEVENEFTIMMPVGSRILSVRLQNGEPKIWATVNADAAMEERTFTVIETGDTVNAGLKFVGTFMLSEDRFVGHLFEIV